MSEVAQRFRMTFKCSCGTVFKKLTTDVNLQSAPCPECKSKKKKIKQFKIGDGPVPSTETKAQGFEKPKVYPNVIYECKDCHSYLRVREEVGENALDKCLNCDSAHIVWKGTIDRNIPNDAKIQNKAVDMTADIVMEDYKMGDLKDNVRAGESMAPKLDPARQHQADNFFGGAKKRNNAGINTAALAKRAMAGSMRDRNYRDPVAALQPAYKPRLNIVAGDGVKG